MPWVPRDLYRLMFAALEAQAGLSAGVKEDGSDASTVGQRTVTPTSQDMAGSIPAAPTAPTLSDNVLGACRQFAFGDDGEYGMNVAQAQALAAKGTPEHLIVAAIERGAVVSQ